MVWWCFGNCALEKNYDAHYPALIRRVTVNGDSIIYNGGQSSDDSRFEKSVLSYDNNTVRIEYAAPYFDNESANQYQYFMDGFEKGWSDWTNETFVDYRQVPEGKYTFRVRARNVYHKMGDEAAFVNGECRGLITPLQRQQNMFFLMIYSNESSGEQVEFKYYNAELNLIYDISERLDFEVDASLGQVQSPFKFTAQIQLGVEANGELPTTYDLLQNYPNPFNPQTTIKYSIPKTGNIKLQIFNINGQLVRTLIDNQLAAGFYRLSWDGRDENGVRVPSGVLFYRLLADGYIAQKKMILLK